ncbi:MAG TPA: phosphopantetheinyl transferase [Sulfitobacter sp.]|uniref:4'-phosphopantetheinyl transferase family protein n=1 Tax=Sulfitobacter sp. TaxID=1903071 RepID=UPI000EDABAD2|nr:4'-phosphopantetheinyl transferase superfamily protein [Sulfitobacter sp.]HCQ59273.1 phosphopantetheinyl transferase [Sulfitobacter sp.]
MPSAPAGGVEVTAEAEIKTAVRSLFDLPVAVAVTQIDRPHPPLLGDEAAVIARARPKRVAEFTAGRHAAREAMQALGHPPAPVLASPDRAPIWPQGLTGSISHSDVWCIAVLARCSDVMALGVDIEKDSPLPKDLLAEICLPSEITRLGGADLAAAKRIFCAKEAAYKAQYPLTKTLFGFDRLDVTLSAENPAFDAQFTQDTECFKRGEKLPGRVVSVAGHLVSGVAIGQIDRKGA